jgi:tRNA-uridine 2-sulfurtransferase
MSGGVDSTACVLLLRHSYRVQGFFMRLAQPDYPAQEARVRQLADRLGVALTIVDLRDAFRQKVLAYTATTYRRGQTPNPCLVCNREIKFGLLLEAVLAAGMAGLATGHYAVLTNDQGRYRLFAGADRRKDQSYFLSRLGQRQLARCLFPLGRQSKEETYRLVAAAGFDDFHGQESQDVCFLADGDIGTFVEKESGGEGEGGPILNRSGSQLGCHRGLYRYTIGQRRGLGIAAARPLYVTALDPDRNALIVGEEEELLRDRFQVRELHWLAGTPPAGPLPYTVRLRSGHRGCPATLTLGDQGRGDIRLDQPQRAITPGQFAVLYHDDELLGSGIIE